MGLCYCFFNIRRRIFMITKELLKKYASKLMFDMKDEEYETLQKEFDVMLKRIEAMTKDPKEISLFDYKERRRTKKRNGYDPLAI